MSRPAAAAAAKPVGKELHVKLDDDHKHDAKVKKVLTTRYNMDQLKKITVFDSWVDEELERLTSGKSTIEVDFEEWDTLPDAKRKPYLESLLGSLPDAGVRKKFVDEYTKRATVVQKMLHDPTLQKKSSGSKLVN